MYKSVYGGKSVPSLSPHYTHGGIVHIPYPVLLLFLLNSVAKVYSISSNQRASSLKNIFKHCIMDFYLLLKNNTGNLFKVNKSYRNEQNFTNGF